ncbi:hypothetical protein N6H18_03645 [Reichenbachiella agarivorans]|uniref:Uncharacterized protein n=1 Tax=Reichenbachiella agarivorans TaxID=2979464 RepID=A0ABY6CRB0_9BACT|nr:hypothetical protein [Reichenbachiella agarivorans]UXP33050.1 hypothetical protein N6H18_03645 [Reichenbachiella agarivorans]
MKNLILSIIILSAIGCSTGTEKNNSSQQQDTSAVSAAEQPTSEPTKPSEANETEEVIEIKSLTGTIWIHRPFEDFPNCVDTLNFVNDTIGYEYRLNLLHLKRQ